MAAMRFKSHRRRMRGRLLWPLTILIAVVLVFWGVGLMWFAAEIPKTVEDAVTKTDAIAVLTGGRGRLGVGFQLLSDNFAKKLFISGVYRGVDVNHLLELFKQKPEDLRCCLEIGHSADNTAGNAVETATWIRKNGFQKFQWNNIHSFVFDRIYACHSNVLNHTQVGQVFVAKGHPESGAF